MGTPRAAVTKWEYKPQQERKGLGEKRKAWPGAVGKSRWGPLPALWPGATLVTRSGMYPTSVSPLKFRVYFYHFIRGETEAEGGFRSHSRAVRNGVQITPSKRWLCGQWLRG